MERLALTSTQPFELAGGWRIEAIVDEDNHLAIWLSNSDGTQVHDVGADIGDENEWAGRFSTKGIEEKYRLQEEDE